MKNFENNPLYKIMHPRSIAFWGASTNSMSMGSIQLANLLSMGFEGEVYPIHPKDKEINGLKAYSKISDVPGKTDLAILILPTGVVPGVLEECGLSGIKKAIIVSAGFSEKEGREGKLLQKELVDIAKRYGMTFVGPNCIGVINPSFKLNTTFFPYDAKPGFIGMASESGSFITQMFVHLAKFNLGFSQGFSLGNEAMVDLTDCIEYLAHCPATKVIALYIEGIRRGRRFVEVARRVSKIKPIVAFYVGGSKAGGRAGLSHTGAMAGPDHLYEGIFRQCGIIRAHSIEELFDFCYVLGSQPLPKGNRLGILTHSGGPGAAAADSAERSGLELSELTPSTAEALAPMVPNTASIKNPVDLTFAKNYSDYMATLPRILLKDENIDLLFIYCLMPHQRVISVILGSGMDTSQASEFAQQYIKNQSSITSSLASESGKPVVGGSFCDRTELFVRELQDYGMPVLPSPERAVSALGALYRYSRWLRIFS
jgi:acetate---CoA ligase (ADP-forming) subunit alpha